MDVRCPLLPVRLRETGRTIFYACYLFRSAQVIVDDIVFDLVMDHWLVGRQPSTEQATRFIAAVKSDNAAWEEEVRLGIDASGFSAPLPRETAVIADAAPLSSILDRQVKISMEHIMDKTLAQLAGTMREDRSPSLGKTIAQSAIAQQAADDAQRTEGEEPVTADPKYDRSTFVYLEPREGIDGPDDFCQCISCQNFVPERAMRGVTAGNRCVMFGSSFPVEAYASCTLYAPWPQGKPEEWCISHEATHMMDGCRGSVTPGAAGYINARVQCHRCRQFDEMEKECELYECLNAALPNIFALNETVDRHGCCDAWNRDEDDANAAD